MTGTLLVAMVLSMMPLPESVPPELGYLRPEWVLMVLVYWTISLPHRVGIFTAWLAGMMMDILLGSLLGQHALSFAIVAYVSATLYQRMRMYGVWQQAVVVFAFLALNQLINFWVENITGSAEWSVWNLAPALSGALLWPWTYMALRYIRRKLRLV